MSRALLDINVLGWSWQVSLLDPNVMGSALLHGPRRDHDWRRARAAVRNIRLAHFRTSMEARLAIYLAETTTST